MMMMTISVSKATKQMNIPHPDAALLRLSSVSSMSSLLTSSWAAAHDMTPSSARNWSKIEEE